jgi:VanZ family protein
MIRMKKMALSPWLTAVLYVFFIYATLSVVPAPLMFLRSHNLLRLTLGTVYSACVVILLSQMAYRGEKRWWRFAALLGIFSLYPLIAMKTSSPEEQLHFLEYGLVGVLFARAISGGQHYTWKIYSGALALGGLAGWIDEILQGLLPNRHYDVRDIWLNIVSVALGLALRSFFPSKNPASNPPR